MKDIGDRFLGKYRGRVHSNADPEKRGRIQALVPDVLGKLPSTWALPCLPAAGLGSGVFVVPDMHSSVWIEFEQGDPDYPIWTGCFWVTAKDLPATAAVGAPPVSSLVLQTLAGNSVTLAGTPEGGIVLKVGKGPTEAKIALQPGMIELSVGGGSIVIKGPKVTINDGALEIT